MPTVSVIIPAYNCETYIAETISSVLNQTYTDFELIVVDDGSTDRTASIVSGFGPTVRLIRQANASVCNARNHGLRESKGQFICFMDHDDFWFPGKLDRQLQAFQQHPEAGAVYTEMLYWCQNAEDGSFPPPESLDLSIYEDDINYEMSGWIYTKLLQDSVMLTSTVMFRAEVFSQCGDFDESLPYSEDWDLFLRVSRKYSFISLRRPTTLYRQHALQGNRTLRDIDYRTALLSRAVEQWGLCGPDGSCLPQKEFDRMLAKYHADHGLTHLRANSKAIAMRSFFKALITNPWYWKHWLYPVATLLGWKPNW